MSTNFILSPTITKEELLAAMEKMDITIDYENDDYKPTCFPIVHDGMYAWVDINDEGNVGNFTTYGINDGGFLYDLADHANVSCFSEHDEGFDEALDELDGEGGGSGLVTIDLRFVVYEHVEPNKVN